MDEIKKYLEAIAKKEACYDIEDFDASDSGNFDDAYRNGNDDGKIDLARTLLYKFFEVK